MRAWERVRRSTAEDKADAGPGPWAGGYISNSEQPNRAVINSTLRLHPVIRECHIKNVKCCPFFASHIHEDRAQTTTRAEDTLITPGDTDRAKGTTAAAATAVFVCQFWGGAAVRSVTEVARTGGDRPRSLDPERNAYYYYSSTTAVR